MISSARFHCKTTSINTGAFIIHYGFEKSYPTTVGHSAAKPANTRDDDVHHQRTESPDPAAEKKIQGNFKILMEVVCLIWHSVKLDFFFQAAGGKFHRHTLCSLGKSTLLTEGRIITGAQQIIIPMIGHEVEVGGRSNFLS